MQVLLINKGKDDFSMALWVATTTAQSACHAGIIYTKHTSLMTMALFLHAQQSTFHHFVQASHVRMEQITECCYDTRFTLNMPHILHGMSKLASYKFFARVWSHHPSTCNMMLNHWVRSSRYFEGTYCLRLQQFRDPIIQGEYIA